MKAQFPFIYNRLTLVHIALLVSLIGSVMYIAPVQAASFANFTWAGSMGGTGMDHGTQMEIDSAGNIYITGSFQGTADFDPGVEIANLTSVGGDDIFIAKLDSNGNFLWAQSIGGVNDDRGSSLAVDTSGNVYTTGSFQSAVDFDPGIGTTDLTSLGGDDIFISKLDSNGNFLWARSMGGADADHGAGLTADTSGNVYTIGSFQSTVDFDPGAGTATLTSTGGDDIFISKLDSNGNFTWAKSMGGPNADVGTSIALDTSGNVYCTGSFQDTVDFDPGIGITNLTSVREDDIFISKLDNNGNFVWARSIGGYFGDKGVSLAVDTIGNVYTTGYFRSYVDFDPGIGTSELYGSRDDIFISKLDNDGNFVWAQSDGTDWEDRGLGIAVDAGGNTYTIGTFDISFYGPGYVLISKRDNSGNLVWKWSVYAARTDASIAVDTGGNVYTAGTFEGTGDFNPGDATTTLTSVGGFDIFVSKLHQHEAAPIVVNTQEDENLTNGFCSLREAITNANDDAATFPDCAYGFGADTISFAGDYTITLVDQLPDITSRMSITGNGADKTVIQASTCNPVTLPGNCTPATYRAFWVNWGSLSLDKVSVRNGYCDGQCTGRTGYILDRSSGGAILIAPGGALTLTNSSFSGNSATSFGGAIGMRTSGYESFSVSNSAFSGNLGGKGGAISTEFVSMTVSSSIFTDNSAKSGGAIQVFHTFGGITNSTFSRNSASSLGGGIYINAKNSLTIANSTFSDNSAGNGGGIARVQGWLVLVNSTISGNSAINLGGGIMSAAGDAEFGVPLIIKNSTITGNSAANGGGIATEGFSYLGVTSFTNTIVANSPSGGNCYGSNINDGNNLDSGNTCKWGKNKGSISNKDPKLDALADNGGSTQTHALLKGSPAIDKGDPDVCNADPVGGLDQRGMTRPQGAGCDMGAFEVEYRPAISGNVGVAGATLNYTDGTPKTVTADNTGNYSISVPVGWSGTVKPSQNGQKFTPLTRTYSNVQTDQPNQDYTAEPVAGGADTTGVFRPSNGLLYLKNKNESGFADIALNYGMGGDYPITGDWNGDGTDTIGVYRDGTFYLRNENTNGFAEIVFPFGQVGDQPIAGDWNGDGVDSIGVFRNGTFYLRNTNDAGVPEISFGLGNPGDVGIAGDWDGDGIDTTGVFRPSNGVIFLKNKNETGFADIALNYGLPGDRPVTGDWDNDGTDTIGVYRDGAFYLRNENTNGFAELIFGLGNPGDIPIAGNWDGLP